MMSNEESREKKMNYHPKPKTINNDHFQQKKKKTKETKKNEN